MQNKICQMLSFCWKLLSAYFAEKKNDYQVRLLNTVVTAKCACIRNTNVCFSNLCMQVKLVNILTYFPILSYKYGATIP